MEGDIFGAKDRIKIGGSVRVIIVARIVVRIRVRFVINVLLGLSNDQNKVRMRERDWIKRRCFNKWLKSNLFIRCRSGCRQNILQVVPIGTQW